ncbi:uncharacterized protein B0P05DRAFT_563721 [Gilbertella persicaria]|uniref:uncharacterized protein n=1 Tax=Gilbertella persicaria TaxID=101096 RepID=UPI00221EEFE7|nr:uncharacterized protein B0P05DRAFT_563721 [Gilbertella persicaria]KAI8049443.1 hypothetical protein B0P05DRAFT_563721 [Gilbertella persicaria]
MKILSFILLIGYIHTVYTSSLVDLSHPAHDINPLPAVTVDTNRFTQLLSNHLLFDHFDKAYYQLARKISLQFRDVIHVKVKKIKTKSNSKSTSSRDMVLPPPVDIQILKRQLKGAVGSFIEDKLPAILTNRYNTSTLQTELEHLLYQYCPSTHNLSQCILDNREPFLTQVHHYTTQELQSTLSRVNQFDLPRLFEKTRAQISGILIHFNQHTMDTKHHRLELKIKSATNTSSTAVEAKRDWITFDMMQDFISTIHHTDTEEGNTIQHFLDLAI